MSKSKNEILKLKNVLIYQKLRKRYYTIKYLYFVIEWNQQSNDYDNKLKSALQKIPAKRFFYLLSHRVRVYSKFTK